MLGASLLAAEMTARRAGPSVALAVELTLQSCDVVMLRKIAPSRSRLRNNTKNRSLTVAAQ
jgi:hypothetical protein